MSRDAVIKEVLDAPRRRVDNEISRLTEASNELMIHAKVIDFVVCQYSAVRSSYQMQSFAFASTSALAAAIVTWKYRDIKWFVQEVAPSIALSLNIDDKKTSVSELLTASSALLLSSATAFYGLFYWHSLRLNTVAAEVLSLKNLQEAFDNIFSISNYGKSVSHLRKLWIKVNLKLANNVTVSQLQQMTRVTSQDIQFLARVQEEDIPDLRRRANPNQSGLSPLRLAGPTSFEGNLPDDGENGI